MRRCSRNIILKSYFQSSPHLTFPIFFWTCFKRSTMSLATRRCLILACTIQEAYLHKPPAIHLIPVHLRKYCFRRHCKHPQSSHNPSRRSRFSAGPVVDRVRRQHFPYVGIKAYEQQLILINRHLAFFS